jgi:hypothetical protein
VAAAIAPLPSKPLLETSVWALPKTAGFPPENPPSDKTLVGATRKFPERETGSSREPSAEELVAVLSRKASRMRIREKPAPLEHYRARPISFTATRWEVFKMWARSRWRRLSFAGVGLVLALGAAYWWKLVSLNAEIDRQWNELTPWLRQRYALVPSYVTGIASFSNQERYTFAVAEKALATWRTARTDEEIAAAAVRMEQALSLLAKVMKRYTQDGVASEAEQVASSLQFGRLEEKREQSRALLREQIRTYNQAVTAFNERLLGVPGSWLAPIAHLHARAPLYAGGSGADQPRPTKKP